MDVYKCILIFHLAIGLVNEIGDVNGFPSGDHGRNKPFKSPNLQEDRPEQDKQEKLPVQPNIVQTSSTFVGTSSFLKLQETEKNLSSTSEPSTKTSRRLREQTTKNLYGDVVAGKITLSTESTHIEDEGTPPSSPGSARTKAALRNLKRRQRLKSAKLTAKSSAAEELPSESSRTPSEEQQVEQTYLPRATNEKFTESKSFTKESGMDSNLKEDSKSIPEIDEVEVKIPEEFVRDSAMDSPLKEASVFAFRRGEEKNEAPEEDTRIIDSLREKDRLPIAIAKISQNKGKALQDSTASIPLLSPEQAVHQIVRSWAAMVEEEEEEEEEEERKKEKDVPVPIVKISEDKGKTAQDSVSSIPPLFSDQAVYQNVGLRSWSEIADEEEKEEKEELARQEGSSTKSQDFRAINVINLLSNRSWVEKWNAKLAKWDNIWKMMDSNDGDILITHSNKDKRLIILPRRPGVHVFTKLQSVVTDPSEFGVNSTILFASNAVLVDCNSEQGAEKLQRVVEESKELLAKSLERFRFVIWVHDLPANITESELAKIILENYEEYPLHIQFIPYKLKVGVKVAKIDVHETLLKKMNASQKLQVEWHEKNYTFKIQVQRCLHCFLLGHLVKFCPFRDCPPP